MSRKPIIYYTLAMFQGCQDPPKYHQKALKKSLRSRTPQNSSIFVSWNPQDRNKRPKGFQKGAPREAKVEPKWRKMTSKRVLKYGVCPKGSPGGSDGVWRVPLEAIWGSFLMILGCSFIAFSYNARPCPTLKKKRYVVLSWFRTFSSLDRSAIQPRRKERSSAEFQKISPRTKIENW